MQTLSKLADAFNADLKCRDGQVVSFKLIDRFGSFYFSGDVVAHISVKDDKGGLNNTGEWPHYLVNDEGTFKILPAS